MRYLAVGSASFVVFFVLGSLPMLFPTLPAPPTTGIAVAAAGVVNFFGHRHFTFVSRRPLMESLPRYCLLIGFNSALGAGIVALLAGKFAMPLVGANLISLVAITVIAYLLLQKFVV
jgi:putative flippase GtrA